MSRHGHGGRSFMLGAMLGSTVGAISTMMFTTKKGHSFKKHAMEKLHEFEGLVKKLVHKNKRKVMGAVKTLKRVTKGKKKHSRKKR